ncbi:serine/threonine protein kinase [Mesorhizobium sp. M4B.F.Ca.ET.215.01.1.1]|uniref:serine/threonine-protein kinase n=4 Tax=Mesorhizobium TaxID=68287 RepID=UPI000FCCAC6F|nr:MULTISPECIES: serine/threonine-protein kinase [unclassified Mesorhizobium]RVD37983.1 serine/threonine protein kinase [Mesorhizobium sp. M4B.F.Ca.ET.019.03.1.1]TGQ09399.1 serine/threonine protein kinase [Mesorhizobium sp. M4B.F.Ca.ET.215.01.1.1]TGQ37564.1 serine/threonine protein kinase [Mesorhizobium sp. M00.F.Ca.ET.220.01.1.1]TGQ99212.1 serine/threonine protein kinase [Mesorhizobium sp. M4B.F.Ca.ET.203.01.1.1]TGR02234.1 serine/threonine protein kinase [Mesorhizobium sp. M4B.F.Ca.ET.200.01.
MSADDKTRVSPSFASTGVGTQLSGIYELDERIASGGMGEVYRGHNIQTGDRVAIKIVLPEFARDQTILSLFRKEASILNHLSHDAVVRYHVFTIDPGIGRPYLAMEFVDGQSLFDVIRRGAMPVEDVRKLCHRLASALSAVHQAGAIHRDLSPDNIILPGGRVDRAKIIDFGIARSAAVGGETLIGGRFAGKYNYVSPEQLGLYGGEVSEQSDIYSMGLVLAAALRGNPLDMSGSQLEIVEKRRTVPDLSDIDADFREIIEAMLQPDPKHRPISMAEIARMTRDPDEETRPPVSAMPRERPDLHRTSTPAAPEKSQGQAWVPPGDQRFVPHQRPAHLSEPRPRAAAPPPRAVAPDGSRKPARTRNIAIAAVAALALVSGAGVYLNGLLTPAAPPAGKTTLSPSKTPKPAPADSAATTPPEEPAAGSSRKPQTEAGQPPAEKPAAPTPAPVEKPADVASDQKPAPTQPAEPLPSMEEEPKPPTAQAQAPTEQAPSANQQQASDGRKATAPPTRIAPAPPTEEIAPASPPVEKAPAPVQPDIAEAPKPKLPASQPAEPKVADKVPEGAATAPEAANTTSPQPEPPAAKQPGETVVLNVPKPQVPPAAPLDETALRASWVRDFSGGDCFYATMTSATANAAAIEGFGTAVQPFERLMSDFQSRFGVEPDISVRLIEPAQCEVTNFLRSLGRSDGDKPQLVLDRTLVPNGAPIGGTLVTRGGLISNVLLIDHKGMAFNLDDRMVVQAGKASFSIPIELGAADKTAGKVVPQVILVITGPRDIPAAVFTRPTPASELLPRILAEIEARGSDFSATAKYFRLGG